MERAVLAQAHSWRGDCAVVIRDMAYPKLSVKVNEDKIFPAASLIKLPILAVAFKAIDEGRFSLDTVLVIGRGDIAGGSGRIKTMNLPQRLKVRQLMAYMIAYSDNTATNVFIRLMGYDYLNSGFKSLGLQHTVLRRAMMDFSGRDRGVENYTSAADIALILEGIHNKKLVSKKYCQLAVYLLKKQTVRDRLPLYLPNNASVANKTGLERGVVHDAGIVFSSKGNYVICVLTGKVKAYKKAKNFIAQMSRLAYNAYSGNSRRR